MGVFGQYKEKGGSTLEFEAPYTVVPIVNDGSHAGLVLRDTEIRKSRLLNDKSFLSFDNLQ